MFRRRLPRLGRFVEELKRRRVIRVGFAYVVVAFAILEAADLILPALLVPDWTYRLLVVMALFFLPLVLALAWVYDLTPEGVKRTASKVQEEPNSAPSSEAGAKPVPASPTGSNPRPAAGTATLETGAISSLAILPFTNSGRDADGEYLSDGITESIINKMSSIEGIRVVPRASAFRYKNQDVDPREVQQSLGVRALVTGRIMQRGGVLIAQAELVDLSTESQLWGEHYNRPVDDIFQVQEDMADEIVRSLRLQLSAREKARLAHRETEDPDAYRAYLRGRHYWNKRTAEGLKLAIVHFQRAIDLDPNYALAYSGMADTYNVLGYYNIQDPRDAYPRALAAARRVLEIDDGIAEAHASLGYALLFFERAYEDAAAELQRAISLKPSYATAHQWYGWYLLVRDRFDEMVESLARAVELDPLSLIINDHYGYAFFLDGRYDDARRQIERTLELDSRYPLAHLRMGNLCLHQNRPDEAIQSLERAVELSGGFLAKGYLGQALALTGKETEARAMLAELRRDEDEHYVSPLDRALVYAGLGEVEKTLADLEEAFRHRTSDLVRVRLLPWPREVREHPGFEALVQRLGLVPA